MNDNTIKEYTRRISSGNRSEIIVCVFDIGEIYMNEACECFENGDEDDFRTGILKASKCINDLLESINYEYELAFPLMRIYMFMNKELSVASATNDVETVRKINALFVKMKESFLEVAKQDTSAPVMQNTQPVFAGLTYGRNSLNESLAGDQNRGFKV